MKKQQGIPQSTGGWEFVTPAMAQAWLELNLENRKLRPGVAEKYCADLKAGAWSENPEPVIFYDDTILADGQHRLWAIVLTGISAWMYVMRDVPRSVALNINTGLGRSLVDNAKIAGHEQLLSNRLIATGIMFQYGTRITGRALSNAERLAIIETHGEHLRWADEHLSKQRYIGTAVVGAAVARAHARERNLDRLAEFCKVLSSGMPEGSEDRAAAALRIYLTAQGASSGGDSREVFLKSMNAIRYFMRRKELTVIKRVTEEAYPLELMKGA